MKHRFLPFFIVSLLAFTGQSHAQMCEVNLKSRVNFVKPIEFSERLQEKLTQVLASKGYRLVEAADAPYQLEFRLILGVDCGSGMTDFDWFIADHVLRDRQTRVYLHGPNVHHWDNDGGTSLFFRGSNSGKRQLIRMLKKIPNCPTYNPNGETL